MSTEQEKRDAIRCSIDSAKRRLAKLEILKQAAPKLFEIDRAKQYEMDMHRELIERGERLLAQPDKGQTE